MVRGLTPATVVLALFAACSGDRSTKLEGEPMRIAAAADLKFALDEAIQLYREANPEAIIEPVYGSSGNFHAQIRNGAPFDLYLSADIAYPQALAEEGFALDAVFLYAVGRIVVWVPTEFAGDIEALGIAALSHPSVRKIAIANPEHAPYGRAAVAAMRSLGVYEEVEKKLVYGENIAQAAQFVQSGAAEVGIVALALAVAEPMKSTGRYWEIPLEAYPTMEQGGIVLNRTAHAGEAAAFRDYLLGEEGRELLARYGFFLPGKE